MKIIDEKWKKRVLQRIENDPRIAEDMDNDHNKISTLLLIKFIIVVANITFVIMTICYFEGLLWYSFCDQLRRFKDKFKKLDNDQDYISFFELQNNTAMDNTITSLYFALTTLSTVGFGDYHPRSNSERLLQSFILMFGVSIFSYYLGKFIEILE